MKETDDEHTRTSMINTLYNLLTAAQENRLNALAVTYIEDDGMQRGWYALNGRIFELFAAVQATAFQMTHAMYRRRK
jgi:hypothetical protein